jgi:transcriptional regulator with XRE-family HTH domain
MLGPLCRDARLARNVTQVELARRARVGRTWLSQFEDGQKTSAPLDMVFRVLAELEVAVEIRAVRLP